MTVDNMSVDKMTVDELTSCKNAYLANKFIFLNVAFYFSFEIVVIKLFFKLEILPIVYLHVQKWF